MLLVIDVGNTNTVLGIFKNDILIQDFRIRTEKNTTEDEFNVLLTSLFASAKIDLNSVLNVVISSVVPPVVAILDAFCRKYIGRPPLWVNADTVKELTKDYNNPQEVGADRIVNAVAAFERYQTALIVIDFGTATTFDVISEKGIYLGGAITPGIMIASEALFKNASKLPRVELFSPPAAAIGTNTVESIQSGLIFGYAALVDGMVERMSAEMKIKPMVVATGGLAPLMNEVAGTIEVVDGGLTLEGLRLINQMHNKY